MKNNELRGGLAASAAIAVGLTACLPGSDLKSSALLSTGTNSQAQTNPGGIDDGNYQVVPAGSAFSITGAMDAAINLGAQSEQSYTLHTGAYSGTIRLTTEFDEIQAVDPKSQISVVVSPSTIAVGPNGNYNFTVRTAATQAAPDLALHYHVVARDASGAIRKETEMETEFAVNPVFEITIGAGNAQNVVSWSTDLVDPGTGIGTKQPASFITHKNGVTLRFVNMDPKGPHIVHGSGLIPHQNTGTPLRSLAPGALNPAGKTYLDAYEVKITSTAANASGGYYLHDGESSSKSGKISFNISGTAVKPPVVDPTATFAKVSSTILQTKCIGCHSAGNPSSGVDLSTYAGALKTVVPYDAVSSALYTSILANMPLGGTPLSSTEKDLVKNWIGNGALNN